jgi:hypothetical protein
MLDLLHYRVAELLTATSEIWCVSHICKQQEEDVLVVYKQYE